jgi:3-dehydroquinate dehydratase II
MATSLPQILIINGPNLNMLGTRQPDIYGHVTLDDIESRCLETAGELGLSVDFRQSNHEGELIDWIQQSKGKFAGIIINAGAFSHTSVALLDALLACELPVIEVHLSNIYRRESFRHHSYVSQVALGVICGLGAVGYELALGALSDRLNNP